MATVHAYLAYSHLKPADLIGMDQDQLASALSFTSNPDMSDDEWTHVGTAQITVTLDPQDKIIANTIAGLRKKQGSLQAEATRIESEIQKLLAITNDVSA